MKILPQTKDRSANNAFNSIVQKVKDGQKFFSKHPAKDEENETQGQIRTKYVYTLKLQIKGKVLELKGRVNSLKQMFKKVSDNTQKYLRKYNADKLQSYQLDYKLNNANNANEIINRTL